MQNKDEMMLVLRESNGNRHDIIISTLLGKGTSCRAYRGKTSGGLPVVVKECILHGDGSDEKRRMFFCKAYETQLRLLNSSDSLLNENAHPIAGILQGEIYGHETLFTLTNISNTRTFEEWSLPSSFNQSPHSNEKECRENLKNLLKTIRSISKVAAAYHMAGFLCMDIKPSNILIYPETSERVLFVDFNSVSAKDKISVHSMSTTTHNYSAPEIKRMDRRNVNEKSDIFPIGVMLYEKLFNEKLPSENSPASFELYIKEKVEGMGHGPEITRDLTGLLVKMTCVSNSMRYTDIELITKLTELISVLERDRPYLSSDEICLADKVLGRSKELNVIKNYFSCGTRIVVLQGERGIGKSSIAQEYAKEFRNEYDAVIFKRYEGSIRSLLEDIHIHSYTGEKSCDNVIPVIRDIMHRNKVLLIIDNYNALVGEDPDFSAILYGLPGDIIVTSTTDHSALQNGILSVLPITCTNLDTVRRIYESNSETAADDQTAFAVLYEILEGNTFFFSLLGKLARKTGCTVSEVLQRIKDKGSINAFTDSQKITFTKDGKIYKIPVGQALTALFDIRTLSECQKTILKALQLMDTSMVDEKVIVRWINDILGVSEAFIKDEISDLAEGGWIIRLKKNTFDGRRIMLGVHSLALSYIEENIALEKERILKLCRTMLDWFEGQHRESDELLHFLCTVASDHRMVGFVLENSTQICEGILQNIIRVWKTEKIAEELFKINSLLSEHGAVEQAIPLHLFACALRKADSFVKCMIDVDFVIREFICCGKDVINFDSHIIHLIFWSILRLYNYYNAFGGVFDEYIPLMIDKRLGIESSEKLYHSEEDELIEYKLRDNIELTEANWSTIKCGDPGYKFILAIKENCETINSFLRNGEYSICEKAYAIDCYMHGYANTDIVFGNRQTQSDTVNPPVIASCARWVTQNILTSGAASKILTDNIDDDTKENIAECFGDIVSYKNKSREAKYVRGQIAEVTDKDFELYRFFADINSNILTDNLYVIRGASVQLAAGMLQWIDANMSMIERSIDEQTKPELLFDWPQSMSLLIESNHEYLVLYNRQRFYTIMTLLNEKAGKDERTKEYAWKTLNVTMKLMKYLIESRYSAELTDPRYYMVRPYDFSIESFTERVRSGNLYSINVYMPILERYYDFIACNLCGRNGFRELFREYEDSFANCLLKNEAFIDEFTVEGISDKELEHLRKRYRTMYAQRRVFLDKQKYLQQGVTPKEHPAIY